MSDYDKFIEHVLDIKTAITQLTDRISKLEGKLSNGINSDIKELKDSREKDKQEAIKARENLEKTIVKAIKTNWQICPTTKKINNFLLTKKTIDDIKHGSKTWIMWAWPIGLGIFYFIMNIVLKITGVI